ncbi:MAG TPA: Tic22 family protein [Kamptonema sp.]|nr:Tic22 family protein [Kamptonema sp.]
MKSLVRLGAVLGILGSTLLGPSLTRNMSALALPDQQVLEKLRPVPVFTITDAQGAPLIASVPKEGQSGNNTSVAGVFISQKDAQAFVDRLKTKNPQLAASVRVVPVSLGEIYQLSQANKGKAEEVQFAYVPTSVQVESAKTLLRQGGQQPNEFTGVPLFLARGGPENGYLTIQRGQQQVIPLFFNKEELQGMLERFKQQQPNVASSIKIEVVNLEAVLEAMRTDNDPFLSQIILVPPRESLEYVRTLQPAGGNQAQPRSGSSAPLPSQPRPSQSPAPRQPQPSR